jgi:DNA sulfur modification protein DndE
MILNAPDSHGRYYMIQFVDMYTNSFAYVGGVATGYQGGKFAIVAPGWKGTLPKGLTRIEAPTPWILIQPRVHVANEADLPAARKVLEDITVQGLAAYSGKPAPVPADNRFITPDLTNPQLPVSALDFKDPVQFWQILSAAINENPPPADQISALLPMFKILGIELGKTWDPSKVSPEVLAAMKLAAQQIAAINANLPVGTFINGWFVPPPEVGNAKNNYFLRAIVARIGLTANTPAEAIYFMAKTDNNQKLFDGNKSYTVTFKQPPPYIKPGFWSLTLYDLNNNYTVPNAINRYALGSDNNLQTNADGSITIYIQNKSPGKDKESNWLPANNGPFYLILRSYAPGEAMVKSLSDPSAYTPPAVVETP